MPFVLFDAILYYTEKRMTVDLGERKAVAVLKSLSETIAKGCQEKNMQLTPHIHILSREFYDAELRPLLTRWILIWLMQKRCKDPGLT